MTSYIVLGALLVLMGAAQIWLRWGPWAKEQQQAEKALAERRLEAAKNRQLGQADTEASAAGEARENRPVVTDRGTKLWNKWTAILGPLGILLGLFLVLWGIFQ
jgi:hypothetical protein